MGVLISSPHETQSRDEHPRFFGTNGYPLQSGTVYGPIHSRRYGHSLGINPLPVSFKFCDFDCVYCQYGWTPRPGNDAKKTDERLKSARELLSEIESAFEKFTVEQVPVDVMTIAGNGEPTLHPEFSMFVNGLLHLRDRYYPHVRVGILSDSSQCHRAGIKEALERLDERCMKLDAGDPETIQNINRPSRGFQFERTLKALNAIAGVTIQSLFVQGAYSNTREKQIDRWVEAIRFVQPVSVQVYTVDRPPADSGIQAVPVARLREIKERVRKATGIKSEVFD